MARRPRPNTTPGHPGIWHHRATAISPKPRHAKAVRPVLRAADDGVSPVVGTILVLAITILGIAAILAWGAPTVDRVQAQNAAQSVQGEFEGLRDATEELSVPDHSRFPSVAVPGGEISLGKGTRFMVAADHDAANPSCDLDVRGWGGSTPTSSVTYTTSGCRSGTFEVLSVSGTTVTHMNAAVGGGSASLGGADFTTGDWLFRLTDGAADPTVYAEAWLHSSDRLSWTYTSGTGTQHLDLEGGAIFSRQGSSIFLAKAPNFGDASFGAGYYGLWLRTYAATGLASIQQAGTHQVFLSLASNDLHVDNATATGLRFTFAGDLGEAWCNAMLARQAAVQPLGAAYTAPTPCATGDGTSLRSVTFAYASHALFQFRFLHARIHASLVL